MANNILFDYIFLSLMFFFVKTQPPCGRGERMYHPDDGVVVCPECESGTYMPETEHAFTKCLQCSKITNPDLEILVIPCSRFHDAVILCKHGHYRSISQVFNENNKCIKCSLCQFPEHERGCNGYNNTVCCDPNQETGLTETDTDVCNERPFVCGPGQFLRISTKTCFPCPDGTFMSDHNHTNKNCLKCEHLSQKTVTHAVIIRPCSRTAPTLFGCMDGYFRNPTQESSHKEVPCTQCRSCNSSLVECGMFHDAVCDVQDVVTSPAPSDTTPLAGTPEADALKQLKAFLNESLGSCTLRCLEDGVVTWQGGTAQSESSTRNCVNRCLHVAVSAWLHAVLVSVSLFIFTITLWMETNFVSGNDKNKRCRRFTYGLFVLNVIVAILQFIIAALIEYRFNENERYIATIAMTVISDGIVPVNLVILIFVTKNRQKYPRKKQVSKVTDKGDSAETRSWVPAKRRKDKSGIKEVQADETTYCDSAI